MIFPPVLHMYSEVSFIFVTGLYVLSIEQQVLQLLRMKFPIFPQVLYMYLEVSFIFCHKFYPHWATSFMYFLTSFIFGVSILSRKCAVQINCIIHYYDWGTNLYCAKICPFSHKFFIRDNSYILSEVIYIQKLYTFKSPLKAFLCLSIAATLAQRAGVYCPGLIPTLNFCSYWSHSTTAC